MQAEARLLSINEAAERLHIGQTTLKRLIADGSVRSLKIGTRRLIAASDLDDFVVRLRAGDVSEARR